MTEAEINKLNWQEFSAKFVVRVTVKDLANVWVVPRTDAVHQNIEFRLEKGNLFSFCILSPSEAKLLIEKLQQAVEEINRG